MAIFSHIKAGIIEPVGLARQIFSLVSRELALVEAEFERQARSNVQAIAYLADYLRASGGKRVRPALTILANYAAGGAGAQENVIRLATVMECLHTATLVHDDIIDNAETRRNRSSVNARFGNQSAVLMGDWLYMQAFETSLQERSWPVLDILTAVTRRMTEGELMQLTLIGSTDVNETQYFEVLQRKTAFLFSACCEIGAILAGAGDASRQGLKEYGLQLGTAFQLIDDLLDCTVTDGALGKAAGADLLEGKLTLPLIYLLETSPEWREKLQTLMWDGEYRHVRREELLAALGGSSAAARTKEKAERAAKAAGAALLPLPDSPYKSALAQLPLYILERNH
jgi:octaprenyl-diphosphate synthase